MLRTWWRKLAQRRMIQAACKRNGRKSSVYLRVEHLEDRITPVTNINVTTTLFSDLRDAIDTANATADDVVINLTVAGTFTMADTGNGPVRGDNANLNGDLDINMLPGFTLTINGATGTASDTVIDAAGFDRVFQVLSSTA